MKCFWFLFAFLLPVSALAEPIVCLQPLGAYDSKALDAAERGLTYIYGLKTKRLDKLPLPKSAWYSPRKRWRADVLLDELNKVIDKNKACRFLIGFTKRDISVTKGEHKDWGILGLGEISGRVAVVSTFRMRKRLVKPNSLERRAVKVTNHELGHVLGLPHIKGEGCLMNDAEGTVSTVDKETGLLCDVTVKYIEKKFGWTLPKHDRFDWSGVE